MNKLIWILCLIMFSSAVFGAEDYEDDARTYAATTQQRLQNYIDNKNRGTIYCSNCWINNKASHFKWAAIIGKLGTMTAGHYVKVTNPVKKTTYTIQIGLVLKKGASQSNGVSIQIPILGINYGETKGIVDHGMRRITVFDLNGIVSDEELPTHIIQSNVKKWRTVLKVSASPAIPVYSARISTPSYYPSYIYLALMGGNSGGCVSARYCGYNN